MKSEVLSRFDIPALPLIALILFVVVFIGYTWWTLKPSRKSYFEDASKLPFEDDKSKN